MLAITGTLLVVKQTKPRRTIQDAFIYGGGIIVAVLYSQITLVLQVRRASINFNAIGVIIGVIILVTGVWVRPQIISMRLATRDTSDNDE